MRTSNNSRRRPSSTAQHHLSSPPRHPTPNANQPPNPSRGAARPKRDRRQHHNQYSSPPGQSRGKKEKLYCVCRTPYDETKFYVGCDLCNNWFHGECVGITEESSKSMTEFICTECKHARDTQELFCLCRQPYDESQCVFITPTYY